MKKNNLKSWAQLDFPCKLKEPLLPCLMKLFSTSLKILWQLGRRKQLCKKQFLLICYTTTLHCFQILGCPKESITDYGKWLVRQQKGMVLQRFLTIFTIKNLESVRGFLGYSVIPRPRKEKYSFWLLARLNLSAHTPSPQIGHSIQLFGELRVLLLDHLCCLLGPMAIYIKWCWDAVHYFIHYKESILTM